MIYGDLDGTKNLLVGVDTLKVSTILVGFLTLTFISCWICVEFPLPIVFFLLNICRQIANRCK